VTAPPYLNRSPWHSRRDHAADTVTAAMERQAAKRLADQAEMKATQYGTYENGHRIPNLETLLRLADAANYDVILMPREQARGLADLARGIPFAALAALAALAELDPS
jgi:transcriptional regulator with XRE-family HTH domain